jgi:diguanylate cyclase (GGDEF)-like protein
VSQQPNLSGEELQAAVAHLDQAVYNHEQWYKNLQRALIARLPADDADLQPDAHHLCRFGQWYDGDGAEMLRDQSGFVAIGSAHEQMHASATQLLQRSADGLPISPSDLDQFNNLLDRLRLEIQSLRHELEERMQNRDPLTGARNRTTLLSDLREQQALVHRGLQGCALVMIDLDHFKDVNDSHGHAAGDAVLASTSECIQAELRPYDRIYRYGGEEFLLLLPQSDVDAASHAAERLRAAIAAQEIQDPGAGPPLRITASFGVAALDATRPIEESVDQADKAMYEAKNGGRDRVEASR